ncbi:hypothetical protein BH721_06895 [Clostridium baratii]|uniref:Domain of Uncharacterized Function (DUF1540) n=1 Tax=Clostridium baratii TaxID=1561 RepID=A0A174U6W8_9CLOT|nr:DUF1540 domain-containing protein [Clostridium baratii]OPF50791.1 hypothetical protein A1M12_08115 [Clostridium baratii]OPF54591.1 hypothetical protein BH721_06895 [Clostridium baratii]OPF54897.1 hypothetical protein BH724_01655 [Clostridium baratii]OPF59100.1 hypothetical protein BH725_10790 [Clostridium baratii]CUQ18133.1 Domain of Uncharacterised Function (DUF1540) [Clostridium baratii]
MATLSCGVHSCAHNKDERCCLESIEVGGYHAETSSQTNCESFDEKDGSMSSMNMEVNPNMAIGCSAVNCIYNENQRCVSNYVDIEGQNSCAECASFVPKGY